MVGCIRSAQLCPQIAKSSDSLSWGAAKIFAINLAACGVTVPRLFRLSATNPGDSSATQQGNPNVYKIPIILWDNGFQSRQAGIATACCDVARFMRGTAVRFHIETHSVRTWGMIVKFGALPIHWRNSDAPPSRRPCPRCGGRMRYEANWLTRFTRMRRRICAEMTCRYRDDLGVIFVTK